MQNFIGFQEIANLFVFATESLTANCVSPTQLPMCCWVFVVVLCVWGGVGGGECMLLCMCLFLCESETIQMQVPTYFFHCGS